MPAKPFRVRRLILLPFKLALWFVGLSVAMTVLYKFVPVPVTWTMMFDSNGMTKDWEPLSNISPNLARAVIATEDGKFCTHGGFDWDAIEKARKYNARGGRIRGGSTISQQTAKNVFLWQGGGFFRKGLEAYFTFLIENIWGKRRIIEVYLNVAETGIGTYGAEAGAQRYFKKSAKTLTPREAASIASVLPLPKKRAAAPRGRSVRLLGMVRRDGLDSCLYD